MQIDELYQSFLAGLEDLYYRERKSTPDRPFIREARYYGIITQPLRKLMRTNRKNWMKLSLEQRILLIKRFYNSKNGEQICTGNYILAQSLPELMENHLQFFDELSNDFQGWGVVDDFCTLVLQPFLLKYPKSTLELMNVWNRSENQWKRRASVVIFTRKIGESGQFTLDCLYLVENLLNDNQDLVQKAAGWALKDNLRGNKDLVLPYIKSLRKRGVSSTITLYAIRDLKGKEREEILAIKPDKST